MVWDDCSVKLNSNSSSLFYTGGDIVTGTVTLSFRRKQKVKELTLHIKGVYKAKWTRPKPVIPFVQYYSENRILFEEPLDIFQEFIGTRISTGLHTRNFYFKLPQELPSSFKDDIAKVSYCVELVGKAPFKINKKVKLPFTVQETVNLNQDAQFLTPTYFEFKKEFWKSGHIIIACKTYTGFSARQIIPLKVTIYNNENVYVQNCTASLIQRLTYNSRSGYANEVNCICKANQKVQSREEKKSFIISIQMPNECLPSSKTTNEVIEISYILKIEATFAYHFSFCEEIPVVVASVPVILDGIDD